MTNGEALTVLDRQLLLQLGDRLTRLRKSKCITATELAKRVGLSRTTLSAIESGDPAPSIGTYLRVMSALDIAGQLALIAGDTLTPSLPGTAAGKSKWGSSPSIGINVRADTTRHKVQDLQSIALHEAAVLTIKAKPELLTKVKATLDNWITTNPDSRSAGLWREWEKIIADQQWRKVRGITRQAQELRQASPLVTILSEEDRFAVLQQIKELKAGVVLGSDTPDIHADKIQK